jgi:hypothetical protein
MKIDLVGLALLDPPYDCESLLAKSLSFSYIVVERLVPDGWGARMAADLVSQRSMKPNTVYFTSTLILHSRSWEPIHADLVPCE